MARLGRVERYLRSKRDSGEKLVFVLVDPEKEIDTRSVVKLVEEGADAVLVGGSLNVTPYDVDSTVHALRRAGVKVPIIIFPGGLSNIAASADAILYMVLMNSVDPYWIIGAQIIAAPLIRKLNLEAIPTAYIVYGYGGAAGHVGRAMPIPWEVPYIVFAYAQAAELMGLRLIYLEAGSGSPMHVPPEAVSYARKAVQEPLLIVGGGIRTREAAEKVLKAGADGIVIGTIVEREPSKALEIIHAVKKR